MGLPAALRAHAAKDYNTASIHYQRALEQNHHTPVLFQNYGALLRQFGKYEEAKNIYEKASPYTLMKLPFTRTMPI